MQRVLAATIIALGVWSVARVKGDSLTLMGVGATGTVHLSGSSLPAPWTRGVDVYAGELKWQEQVNGKPAGQSYSTYCIDVQHDINIGSTYTYAEKDLSQVGLSAPVVNGIERLWWDTFKTSSNAESTSLNDVQSMAFQIELWEIINDSNGIGNGATLSFSNAAAGTTMTAGWLDGILKTADGYYQSTTPVKSDLRAWVATGVPLGQQQIFLGNHDLNANAPPVTPLPHAYAGGAGLFCVLGVLRLRRRVKPGDVAR